MFLPSVAWFAWAPLDCRKELAVGACYKFGTVEKGVLDKVDVAEKRKTGGITL